MGKGGNGGRGKGGREGGRPGKGGLEKVKDFTSNITMEGVI